MILFLFVLQAYAESVAHLADAGIGLIWVRSLPNLPALFLTSVLGTIYLEEEHEQKITDRTA